jgi:hypothetical protein
MLRKRCLFQSFQILEPCIQDWRETPQISRWSMLDPYLIDSRQRTFKAAFLYTFFLCLFLFLFKEPLHAIATSTIAIS